MVVSAGISIKEHVVPPPLSRRFSSTAARLGRRDLPYRV